MSMLRLFVAVMLTLVLAAKGWSQAPADKDDTRPSQLPLTRAELREKLESPIPAEFVETSLRDVVAYFADYLHVQIVLDKRSLEEAAVSIDTPVTISLQNIRAGDLLNIVLREASSGASALDFVRRDGYLEIATRAKLDKEMETQIYLVRDLPGITSESPDVDQACDLIQKVVEPSTWEYDGQGTITHLGPILIIRQSPKIHDRIADLLHEAREAIAQATSAKQ